MKKLLFTLLVATTIATSAFASDANKINIRIMDNFRSDYGATATDVNWSLKPTFAKASFTMNGKKVEAFYKLDGQMIGTSKQVSLDELPTDAKRRFAKQYAGYNVKEAIYFDGVEEAAYFISAENAKESVIVKVQENADVSIFQKERKN